MTKTQINWSSSDAKISGFFAVGEVTKNDLRRVPPAGGDRKREIRQLAIELDKIREGYLLTKIEPSLLIIICNKL
jgi:hypothetical protein